VGRRTEDKFILMQYFFNNAIIKDRFFCEQAGIIAVSAGGR